MSKQVCLYFQVHQPNRLKEYSFFEIGQDHFYENDQLNKEVLFKVSEKCYLPANEMLYEQIVKHAGKFKVSFSISGTVLEQFEYFHPRVLSSFRRLIDTGCVEILAETYYHSLAIVFSATEFKLQVEKHEQKVYQLFGVKPTTFRNTELIYNDAVALQAQEMGYSMIVSEGVEGYLQGEHPNQVFGSEAAEKIKVLLRNYKLSDDVSFRFGDQNWNEYPLSAAKFADWVDQEPGNLVNLFMDYETIGEHLWADTGIFGFWVDFIAQMVSRSGVFVTPKELSVKKTKQDYSVPIAYTSWADTEKDLSAWQQNSLQIEALDKVYGLEKYLKQCDDKDLWHIWRKLQTSDHFYYMSTKGANDGSVHNYFSPYNTPYDAYIYFMNALTDLEVTLGKRGIDIVFD